jgi:hypothetical protein
MKVRIRRCVRGLAAGILLVVWIGVGTAQSPDPANGVWKLNAAKSTFSPGPAPKELTVTIEPAGPGRKVTINGVAGDGTPVQWGYSGNFDGKEVRLTGSNPDGDVVILKRVSANATRSTFKKGGKTTIVKGVSVSPDGKTLTVASSGVDAKGQKVKNTEVFDKQ